MKIYLETLFDEMQQRLVLQRTVMMQCLDGLAAHSGDLAMKRRYQELQNAVRDTIDVLEETKKSFKSKQLGELRNRLERVLTHVNE